MPFGNPATIYNDKNSLVTLINVFTCNHSHTKFMRQTKINHWFFFVYFKVKIPNSKKYSIPLFQIIKQNNRYYFNCLIVWRKSKFVRWILVQVFNEQVTLYSPVNTMHIPDIEWLDELCWQSTTIEVPLVVALAENSET